MDGTTLEEIHNMTQIDYFFLNKFQNIINIEHELKITQEIWIILNMLKIMDLVIEYCTSIRHDRIRSISITPR